MSNQNTYKPGQNQSGLDLPTHGPLAYAYSAGYIAKVCPIDWAVGDLEYAAGDFELWEAIKRLKLAGADVCRIAAERIANDIC